MPILRETDARIAWLALPISGVGGFIVFALFAAAVGMTAMQSSVAGLVGLVVGLLSAGVVLRRVARNRGLTPVPRNFESGAE